MYLVALASRRGLAVKSIRAAETIEEAVKLFVTACLQKGAWRRTDRTIEGFCDYFTYGSRLYDVFTDKKAKLLSDRVLKPYLATELKSRGWT